MPQVGQTKPRCKLSGTDGNVFALAARVSQALRRAGLNDQAEFFWGKLKVCDSYDAALTLMQEYVEVE